MGIARRAVRRAKNKWFQDKAEEIEKAYVACVTDYSLESVPDQLEVKIALGKIKNGKAAGIAQEYTLKC